MKRPPLFTLGLTLTLILTGSVLAVQAALSTSEPLPPRPLHRGLEELPFFDSGLLGMRSQGNVVATNFVSWSKITFQSYRDGNWEIYLANGDGSAQTRLTNHGASDIHPRLNRSCTRIVFTSNRAGNYDIYTMKPDGSSLKRLTSNSTDDVNPAWSPDGTRIAFQAYRDGQADIYVMNADGSGQTRLTSDGAYDSDPAWSPDGTQIAFVSKRAGGYRIWVMNADGSGQTQYSTQPYSEHPVWSPDGSQIAYDSDGDGDDWQELWLMNADGSNQREVYDPSEYQTDAWAGSWSPDGQYVAFTRISFVYYEGSWYWTEAYLDAWDSVNPWNTPTRLSSQGMDWRPDWQTFDPPPTSSVHPLPAQSPGPFTVSWSGSDLGIPSILLYNVQVKDGAGGDWTNWLTSTINTSAEYPGVGGHTYYFRSRALDYSNNWESWPPDYDAFTTVEAFPPNTAVRRLPAYLRNGGMVAWSGGDPGGSRIQTYDVQYRDAATGNWTDWQMGTIETSANFSGTAGHAYYFRSRATDNAQNVESWPAGDGDTYTTLYTWGVTGIVWDNAGAPVSGALVTTTPEALAVIPSDVNGNHAAYVAASASTYTAAWEKSGYSGLPSTGFSATQDEYLDIVLPPADNVVRNWGFENDSLGSGDWVASGVVTPVVTETIKHSGDQSVMLGQLSEFSSIVNISNNAGDSCSGHAIAVDSEGALHLVWSDDTPGNDEILYTSRPKGGVWSSPINISNSSYDSTGPAIAIDGSDALHIVWCDLGSIVYATKTKGGGWSTPVEIPNARGYWPDIVIDGEDTLYVMWGAGTQIEYAAKPISGSWSPPVTISTSSSGVSSPVMVVGLRGIIHALWYQHMSGWQIFYASKTSGGAWTSPVNISSNPSGAWSPDITLDDKGILHAVWRDFAPDNAGIVYARKSGSESWTIPSNIASGKSDSPAIAALGTDLYVTWNRLDENYNYDVLYTRKTEGASWDIPINLSNNTGWSVGPAITLNTGTVPHVAWCDYTSGNKEIYYRGPASAEQTSDATVAQVITVPITMSTPTLSFLYQLGGAYPDGATWFSVQVSDDITATTLFSTAESTDTWTHRWFDLTPWASQAVTLAFNVHQTFGYPRTWAYIDEVTIGSAYPDLWVRKDGLAALPGEQVIYNIAYGNRGGAEASGVRITDTLPGELFFTDASPPPITTTPSLAWDVGDMSAKSGPFNVVVTATVAPTAAMWSTLSNTVSIGTPSPELETANNVAQAAIFVGRRMYMPLIFKGYFELPDAHTRRP